MRPHHWFVFGAVAVVFTTVALFALFNPNERVEFESIVVTYRGTILGLCVLPVMIVSAVALARAFWDLTRKNPK